MAELRLNSREANGGLPPVCMRCGDRAHAEKMKLFTWYPPWVNVLLIFGVLPAAIAAFCLTKRMTVHAPLCERHVRVCGNGDASRQRRW